MPAELAGKVTPSYDRRNVQYPSADATELRCHQGHSSADMFTAIAERRVAAGDAFAGSLEAEDAIFALPSLPGGPGIAGLIVVSGRVRAETLPENPNAHKVAAYYETTDAARLDTRNKIPFS